MIWGPSECRDRCLGLAVAQSKFVGVRSVGVVMGLAAAFLVASCSVDGDATQNTADLSSRSVTAADFPVSGATRVPQNSVAYAIGDLIGRPANSPYDPPECQPAAVGSDGAVVYLGIVEADRASFTSAVVGVDDALSTVVDQARACPRATTGNATTATSKVQTRVSDAPEHPAGVDTAAVLRTVETGGDQAPLLTRTMTYIGQQGTVRVYCQYRWPSAGDISSEAKGQLGALFEKALRAAFGS